MIGINKSRTSLTREGRSGIHSHGATSVLCKQRSLNHHTRYNHTHRSVANHSLVMVQEF